MHLAIIDYCKTTQTPPWTEKETRARIIEVYQLEDISGFSEVDFKSIMMY